MVVGPFLENSCAVTAASCPSRIPPPPGRPSRAHEKRARETAFAGLNRAFDLRDKVLARQGPGVPMERRARSKCPIPRAFHWRAASLTRSGRLPRNLCHPATQICKTSIDAQEAILAGLITRPASDPASGALRRPTPKRRLDEDSCTHVLVGRGPGPNRLVPLPPTGDGISGRRTPPYC